MLGIVDSSGSCKPYKVISLSCGIHWVLGELSNHIGEDFELYKYAWEDHIRRKSVSDPSRWAEIETQQIQQVRRGQAGLERFLKEDPNHSEIAAVVVTGGGALDLNLYDGLIATAGPFSKPDLVPIRVDPPSKK
jgi:hypothetical protein